MHMPWKSRPVTDPAAFARGRREVDNRIEEAASRERRMFLLGAGGIAFGGLGLFDAMRTRAARPGPEVVSVERCGGEPLAITPVTRAGPLPLERVQDDINAWVYGARFVSFDMTALRRITDRTYAMTKNGSAAHERLKQHHQANPPDKRAATVTVDVDRQTAIPIGGADSLTWRAEWREVTSPRDGSSSVQATWRMNATFAHEKPQDIDTIRKNPDGFYVVSFHWDRVG